MIGLGEGAIPRSRLRSGVVAVTGLVAMAAVAGFDFGTSLAFNDEWFYRWTVAGLAAGHGFHVWPLTPVVSMVQLGLAAAVAAVGLDPRFWRLTVLPFLAMQMVYTYRLARLLGADREWSLVAAAVPALNPIELDLATSLMSDVAFLGLSAAAAYHLVRWLRGGGLWPVLLFILLAGLQRQLVVAFIPAAICAVVVGRRSLPARREVVGVVLVSAVALATVALPFIAGFASAAMRGYGGGVTAGLGHKTANAFLYFAPLSGFYLMPLTVGLLLARPARPSLRWIALPGALLLAWAVPAVLALAHGRAPAVFPGNYWTIGGLGPAQLEGTRSSPYPYLAFAAIELLALAAMLAVLAWQVGTWSPRELSPAGTLLVVLGLSQVLLLVTNYAVVDRHYLSAVAPLAPVLAARAGVPGRRPWMGRWFATLAVVLGVVVYLIGQADFEAWQVAREQASQVAYAMAAPADVDAGFEADGVHLILPHFLATGDPTVYPTHPRLRLFNATEGDPRPGASYPGGRIVVVPGNQVSPVPGASGHPALRALRIVAPAVVVVLALVATATYWRQRRRRRAGR